jgi:hypothetical protein
MRSINHSRVQGGQLAAALTAGAAILLAGCGGSAKHAGGAQPSAAAAGSGHATVDTAFAKRAAAACRQGNQLNLNSNGPPPPPNFNPRHPDVAEMPAMGRAVASGVTPAREALRLTERLGQPTRGAAAWNQFLAAADAWVQELQAQASTLEHAQVKPFITTTHVLQSDLDHYRGAAVNAGVRDCGGIFGPQGGPPPPPGG